MLAVYVIQYQILFTHMYTCWRLCHTLKARLRRGVVFIIKQYMKHFVLLIQNCTYTLFRSNVCVKQHLGEEIKLNAIWVVDVTMCPMV